MWKPAIWCSLWKYPNRESADHWSALTNARSLSSGPIPGICKYGLFHLALQKSSSQILLALGKSFVFFIGGPFSWTLGNWEWQSFSLGRKIYLFQMTILHFSLERKLSTGNTLKSRAHNHYFKILPWPLGFLAKIANFLLKFLCMVIPLRNLKQRKQDQN